MNLIDPTGHDCIEGEEEEAVWKTEKFWNNILTGVSLTATTVAAIAGTAALTVGTAGIGGIALAVIIGGAGATGGVALNDILKNKNSSQTVYMAAGGFGSILGAVVGVAGQAVFQSGATFAPGQIVANANKGSREGIKGAGSKINLNQKPSVSHDKLKNIVYDLYKGQGGHNTIGNGTTMDAVRNELMTGLPTNGKFHTQKANDYLNALNNFGIIS